MAARIFYIDNLRIFLIALVVLHHLSITYGASGDWYYNEVEGDAFSTLILTGFTATNQSFFMGFFFLISAYFTRISLERKAIGTFVKDRSIRLGIPLIIFYFLLSPLTIYMKLWLVEGVQYNFIEFVSENHNQQLPELLVDVANGVERELVSHILAPFDHDLPVRHVELAQLHEVAGGPHVLHDLHELRVHFWRPLAASSRHVGPQS